MKKFAILALLLSLGVVVGCEKKKTETAPAAGEAAPAAAEPAAPAGEAK